MTPGIREGLILSLVSSLQMAEQSALNALSNGLDMKELAAAGAAFPFGKLTTTLLMVVRPSSDPRSALVIDALLLILAAVIGLVPSWFFLSIARFFMGAGAGLGFVCAPVLLAELVPYRHRPAHFLVLGLAFCFSTLISNILPVIKSDAYLVVLACCVFSATTGGLYLWLRPGPRNDLLLSEEEKQGFDGYLQNSRQSKRPIALTNVLMLLNVTIGVPVILAFSLLIFKEFGASETSCFWLGIGFPLCQMVLLSFLHQYNALNRRLLVVGGYALSVFIQFFLLLTSAYDLLPPDTAFLCFWLFALAVSTCVPCNTALCVIAEQFAAPSERLRYGSAGRALMWLGTTISTSTFMGCVKEYGFTWAFFPYVFLSAILLLILVFLYPKDD
ncbi:unnamed protein product, partial [Mesorhabditis belari]|uniref:Uncharacterized protein n=1 Tax=Mesorhabditis belari TaxID=2138241 RepID=A0AAF3J3H8_9BILA